MIKLRWRLKNGLDLAKLNSKVCLLLRLKCTQLETCKLLVHDGNTVFRTTLYKIYKLWFKTACHRSVLAISKLLVHFSNTRNNKQNCNMPIVTEYNQHTSKSVKCQVANSHLPDVLSADDWKKSRKFANYGWWHVRHVINCNLTSARYIVYLCRVNITVSSVFHTLAFHLFLVGVEQEGRLVEQWCPEEYILCLVKLQLNAAQFSQQITLTSQDYQGQ